MMLGKGKSKLLEYCPYQDIAAGRGCGLIDPHFLLVDDLLRLLITRNILANPEIRHRLICVDPARTDYQPLQPPQPQFDLQPPCHYNPPTQPRPGVTMRRNLALIFALVLIDVLGFSLILPLLPY